MKTVSLRKEDIERSWWLVDADGKTLGRIATGIATKLRGKHKPEYTPHIDTGDYVVVVNAEKVKLTGNKEKDKIYFMRNTRKISLLRSHKQSCQSQKCFLIYLLVSFWKKVNCN